MPICATCGAEVSASFHFCGACGTPVGQAAQREVRKVVTALFCDVADSTGHGEREDPERMRHVLRSYFDTIERVIVAHGGLVEKFVGDAVMAVFGLPSTHEDDALRAVLAAVEIREQLPALAEETGLELVLKTGINTGEVVAGSGQTLVTGDAVNVAARLEQAAASGEILLGAETVRLLGQLVEVAPLFPLPLRGKTEPIEAYRFLRLATPEERKRTAFVGRERELTLLGDTFRRASEERELHLVTLLGSAGIGKSRLADEFVESLPAETQIVRGRCLSYGEAITFWPLVEILRGLGEPAQAALERVVSGGATSPQALAWTVQRALEAAAAVEPLVVVLEDLHWAEDALLDLVDSVCELSRGAPTLLLAVARPELLEKRPTWGGGKLNVASLLLEPLTDSESELLLDQIAVQLEPDQRQSVLDTAGGNPLFLEEAIAFVVDGGGDGELPPRISAVLQARLDLLAEPERWLLEAASVEGTVFDVASLERLVGEELHSTLPVHLAALTRKCLIRPAPAELDGEEGFSFHHQLTRDAAYHALPKGERARLHVSFAGWLEERTDEREELEEVAAYHLEQAALCRRELGSGDLELEMRAGAALAAAAQRARLRPDLRAAVGLWRRALALLGDDDPRVPELELRLAIALGELGQIAEQLRLVERAGQHTDDPVVMAHVGLVRLQTEMMYRGGAAVQAARELCAGAIPLFEERGDYLGVCRAWHTLALMELRELQMEAAAEAWANEAERARLAGDRARAAESSAVRILMLGLLRTPFSTAIRELGQLAREFPGEPMIEMYLDTLRALAMYHGGRVGEARLLAGGVIDRLRRAGYAVLATGGAAMCGWSAALSGDLAEGERLVSEAARELQDGGLIAFHPWILTRLADVHMLQGRYDQALRLAEEAEQCSGDPMTAIEANAVRASVNARLGAVAEAKAAACAAVALAEMTDSILHQAYAEQALAEALAAAGELPAALVAAEEARRLCEAIERTLHAQRATALANGIEQRIAQVGEPAPAA